MKAAPILVVLALVVAALPPTAGAGPRADYKQLFTTRTAGASTGTDTRILYKHPGDPKAKPIPVRREVFTFPAGTAFDSSVVPDCHASDLELELEGKAACPGASWVGGGIGDTSMTGFPGSGETLLDVDGFDDGSDLKLLGGPRGFPLRFVAHARTKGRVVTVDVPRTPGGPPDGESALRRIHNVFPARSIGRHAPTRTPRTCPKSRAWTFRAHFTFADGVVENDVYRMRCARRGRHQTRP